MHSGVKKKKEGRCVFYFCIHESICGATIQVPWARFKGSFKLRLFTAVNLFKILAAVKKTFWKLLLGGSAALSPLSRGNQSLSPWRYTSWHLNWLYHLAFCVEIDYTFSSVLLFNPQINSLCLRELSVQKEEEGKKLVMASSSWAKHTFTVFYSPLEVFFFFIDWDEIWQMFVGSHKEKGKGTKVHNLVFKL